MATRGAAASRGDDVSDAMMVHHARCWKRELVTHGETDKSVLQSHKWLPAGHSEALERKKAKWVRYQPAIDLSVPPLPTRPVSERALQERSRQAQAAMPSGAKVDDFEPGQAHFGGSAIDVGHLQASDAVVPSVEIGTAIDPRRIVTANIRRTVCASAPPLPVVPITSAAHGNTPVTVSASPDKQTGPSENGTAAPVTEQSKASPPSDLVRVGKHKDAASDIDEKASAPVFTFGAPVKSAPHPPPTFSFGR